MPLPVGRIVQHGVGVGDRTIPSRIATMPDHLLSQQTGTLSGLKQDPVETRAQRAKAAHFLPILCCYSRMRDHCQC